MPVDLVGMVNGCLKATTASSLVTFTVSLPLYPGRLFGGLINDIRRKAPHYLSDYKDGISIQVRQGLTRKWLFEWLMMVYISR